MLADRASGGMMKLLNSLEEIGQQRHRTTFSGKHWDTTTSSRPFVDLLISWASLKPPHFISPRVGNAFIRDRVVYDLAEFMQENSTALTFPQKDGIHLNSVFSAVCSRHNVYSKI
jgi:hypothetical protein